MNYVRESDRWIVATGIVLGLFFFVLGVLAQGCGAGAPDECASNADCPAGWYCLDRGCVPVELVEEGTDAALRARLLELPGSDAAEPGTDSESKRSLNDAGSDASAPGTDAGSDAAPPGTDAGSDAAPAGPPICDVGISCSVWCSDPCGASCGGGPFVQVCGPMAPSGYYCCAW